MAMLEATERNLGKAILDEKQQLWTEKPGVPWIGGTPFPEPKTGLEVMWNYYIRKNPYDDLMWVTPVTPIVDLKKDGKGNRGGDALSSWAAQPADFFLIPRDTVGLGETFDNRLP